MGREEPPQPAEPQQHATAPAAEAAREEAARPPRRGGAKHPKREPKPVAEKDLTADYADEWFSTPDKSFRCYCVCMA